MKLQPAGRPGKQSAMAADQLAEIRSRASALRQAAAMPDADMSQLLDAMLGELDAALGALDGDGGDEQAADPDARSQQAERRLLQSVFQQVPMALFLLGPDGTIRRANAAAATLLGTNPGYATGKRLTALFDQASRALATSQFAAAARTGEPRQFACGLLSGDGIVPCQVAVRPLRLRGDEDRLIVAVTPGSPAGDRGSGQDAAVPAGPDSAEGVLVAMTRRLDLVMAANRLLLENAAGSEGVLLQRLARLLADHLATWVLVDLKQSDRLVRHTAAGPDSKEAAALAKAVMAAGPEPGSAIADVAWTGSTLLLAHAEDDVAGTAGDGTPVLVLLRGTSVLCVPIAAEGVCFGTLTLVRAGSDGHFAVADAGIAEEVAEQLARAMTTQRTVRRRTETAEALQASLLPRELPAVPGVRISAAHLPPTLGSEAGGDFYDIYPTPDGWGVVIGDVCGAGKDAAAVTAAARHAIRVLGHWEPDPVAVLRAANDIMLAEDFDRRFVTADAAHLRWKDGLLRVVLGSAGHPGPVLVSTDGRVQSVEGGGVPLGVFSAGEVAVVERELQLEPGDVLFFCTDGLTGARSADLGYFGDSLADRLAELAGRAPADMIAALQRSLAAFCDGVLLDDVTMLALQATAPPGP